jgi:hypothetical protein
MSINDLKIYIINFLSIAISFSNIESALKIVLLLASIVYTFIKIHQLIKNKPK